MKVLWLLVWTICVSGDKLIELDPTLEPVPLASLLKDSWRTCQQPEESVVNNNNISSTSTEEPDFHDDFDYGSPDGTFEHPALMKSNRVTWQLMSRALEWELSQAAGTRRHTFTFTL